MIVDIKFHQNHVKFRFLMIFIVFNKILIKILLENGSKRFKTVQKDQNDQILSKHVIMWFKKLIFDLRFHKNHGNLSFSMGSIDSYTALITISNIENP